MLLEDHLTSLPIVLHDIPSLPGHFIVRMNSCGGVNTIHLKATATLAFSPVYDCV
jgi:hypothetical protein